MEPSDESKVKEVVDFVKFIKKVHNGVSDVSGPKAIPTVAAMKLATSYKDFSLAEAL
ncbi:hypothetical protein L0F63_001432 [Massospora cicadina]|nr:hypothetical protein L0F63_001432 [Massospora cicadina]